MRILILTLAIFVVPAFAAGPSSVIGKITMVRTGWNSEIFAVVTSVPMKNPAGCPTPDGAIAAVAQPGYKTYYAAALLGFAEKVDVEVIINETGCVAGRPKLIGINLFR